MSKIQQYNHRLNQIEREIELIQRAADGWEYTGQNNRSQIADQVHNIRVDLAQLRQLGDELCTADADDPVANFENHAMRNSRY